VSRILENISDDMTKGSAADGGAGPDGVVRRLFWAARPRVRPSDDLEPELVGAEAMSLAT
jgi:hypothetical protein